jgi:hypothetical protein
VVQCVHGSGGKDDPFGADQALPSVAEIEEMNSIPSRTSG